MNQLSDVDTGNGTSKMLGRIRNMWQFANLCQWIYIFGKAVQIDESIDIEELEMECLKSHSKVLTDIAFALLKLASSRRGLTFDTLDDQLRKQYIAKAPDSNPLGDENNPLAFASLDIFQKIQVLQTLTQWIMIHPERIRDRMPEQKDVEQTDWRIEPYGWDSQDRVYYVLDDNRIYRLTESFTATTLTKKSRPKSTKRNQRGHRANRQHHAASTREGSAGNSTREKSGSLKIDNGLGGATWECVAVTLAEVQAFLETVSQSDDENERELRRRIQKHLLPILEKQEELTKRRQMQRERELLNLSKLANAKRSSRIADRAEKQRQEEEQKERRRREYEAEEVERRESLAQMKAEQEREFRAFSRHQRLKEREIRQRQDTEDLAQLSEDSKSAPGASRRSGRQSQAENKRKSRVLKNTKEEEADWVFDCTCGLYGQIDDGTHSVACESCSMWQHSKCVGVSEQEAEQPEFHFVCQSCRRQGDAQSRTHKSIIKLKVRPSNAATSVSQSKTYDLSSSDADKGEAVRSQDNTTKDDVSQD